MRAAADLKDEDRNRAKIYIDYIVQKYGLSSEQRLQIGIEGIVKGTKGKIPDYVISAIPSAAELEAQFSPPKKVVNPNNGQMKTEKCWEK